MILKSLKVSNKDYNDVILFINIHLSNSNLVKICTIHTSNLFLFFRIYAVVLRVTYFTIVLTSNV